MKTSMMDLPVIVLMVVVVVFYSPYTATINSFPRPLTATADPLGFLRGPKPNPRLCRSNIPYSRRCYESIEDESRYALRQYLRLPKVTIGIEEPTTKKKRSGTKS